MCPIKNLKSVEDSISDLQTAMLDLFIINFDNFGSLKEEFETHSQKLIEGKSVPSV